RAEAMLSFQETDRLFLRIKRWPRSIKPISCNRVCQPSQVPKKAIPMLFEPDLGPQRREYGLEVASHALLACELQVALEFAVQVAFQHVAGDLRGHDPASGDDWGAVLMLSTTGGERESSEGTALMADRKSAWSTSRPAAAGGLCWPLTLSRASLPSRRLDQRKNPR